jgi:nickel-type superoxide dismutase maturation protease
MLRILKVTGESLSPFFESGDYVVVADRRVLLRPLHPGDIIVFRHPYYGILIKRLDHVLSSGEELFVLGTHPESTDSRTFGPIPKKWVTGRVIYRIKK